MVLVLPLLMMVPFLVYYAATGADVGALGDPAGRPHRPDARGAGLPQPVAGRADPADLAARALPPRAPAALAVLDPAAAALAATSSSASGSSFVALFATILVSALLPSAGAGAEMAGEAQRLHAGDPRLPARRAAADPAAGRRRGVRLPRLPAAGLRRVRPPPGVRRRRCRRCCSPSPTAPGRTSRSSSTGSPSALVAGTLVIVTGGLEAGIAMHVLNNWLAFGAALAYGDMGSALNPTGGTWWSIPVTLTQSLVYLALAWWVARLMGIERRTDPAVLAAPRSPRVRFLLGPAGPADRAPRGARHQWDMV